MGTPVIVLEFNELCPSLMQRFMQLGHLPALSRLYSESQVYTTDAGEHTPFLEPWIQWVTVQTGLPFREHGIYDLGNGHKLQYPRIWDLMSQAGKEVWICGSMNGATGPGFNGYFLPDPWSVGVTDHPVGEFDAFMNLVRSYVQEYTRERVPLSLAVCRKFAWFMLRHGLSSQTVLQILDQILRERIHDERFKRATILDRLQWDVFRWYYKKYNPDFSTFFVNSTAHYQHFYWRYMDPEPFVIKPSEAERRKYRDAILYGYRRMDRIAGECLELAGDDAVIVLATALSQQHFLGHENTGGKKFYRAVDFRKLLEFAGITARARVAPVMAEQSHLYFENEDDAIDAEAKLAELHVGDKNVMEARRNGPDLFVGCLIMQELPKDACIYSDSNGRSAGFYDLFYMVDGTKSGWHHPDGILWIRTLNRTHTIFHERVPLERLAPTLLSLSGVQRPEFMSSKPLPLGIGPQHDDISSRSNRDRVTALVD